MDKQDAQRSRGRRASVEQKPCISKESLSNINAQKSFIAGMRPARRKIKWNSAVSDWDRRGDHTSTRIKVGIDLEELQLLGGVPLKSQQQEVTSTPEENCSPRGDLSFVEGDAVEVLEKKINQTYDSIKRVAQENDDLDEEVEILKEQNQALGQEIAAIPMGKNPTRKGLEQLISMEKKMKKKLRELEKQCKLLKRRKEEIEKAKRRTRSEDGLDESRSYATQTSKSISTFVDSDTEEDEEIEVFTTGKAVDSESDSELESDSYDEEEEIIEEIVEETIEEKKEDEEESLGSLLAGEEDLSECMSKSSLGDSLKELPYEPSIALL